MSVAAVPHAAARLSSPRLSRDARVVLATAGVVPAEQHPRLFAIRGKQRSPRCYGRVGYPVGVVTDRQKEVRATARRWWVVLCSSAADGARVIEQLLEIERVARGLKKFSAAVLDAPELRRILDAGRNARGAA